MAMFRKKPVVIEAIQFTGDVLPLVNAGWNDIQASLGFEYNKPVLRIRTLEGVMTANVGDWIIRGIKGEYYPCKDEIFKATYEAVS